MKTRQKLLSFGVLMLIALSLTAAMAIGISAAESAPALDVAYCNLSFRDSVVIKYAIYAENIEAPADNVKLLIWTEPQSGYLLGTEDAALTAVETQVIGGKEHTVFDYTKLSARQMTDVVYARAYAEVDGEAVYSDVTKYSILQYAYNKLGKTSTASTDQKLINMLNGMLNYGALAQEYFNYKTDSLATDEFYQIKAVGGSLSDGSDFGLFKEDDTVTLTAPESNSDGLTFSHWADSNGNEAATSATVNITVKTSNETYTAVYETIKYSEGLEFTSNGDGTCYVSSIGTCTDTDIIIPTHSPDQDKVTAIGEFAFENCKSITSIIIPNSVTFIDYGAFSYCRSLALITIPDSVTSIGGFAFFSCYSLTGITIPNSVTAIGNETFRYCSSLTSITIPDSVTSIGSSAFSNCSALASITISNSVTSISYAAFSDCSSLTSITIPDSVTSIVGFAFSNCSALASITISNSVTSIGPYTFGGCFALSSINYMGTTTQWNTISKVSSWNDNIGKCIVYCTDGIGHDIVIDEAVAPTCTESGLTEGKHCKSCGEVLLAQQTVPATGHADGEWVIDKEMDATQDGHRYMPCANCGITLREEVIPSAQSQGLAYTVNSDNTTCTITGMGECTDKEIYIPEAIDGYTVTAIGDMAFADETEITVISIPNTVTSIGKHAFLGCTGLAEITIPESVNSIGVQILYNTTNLKTVYYNGTCGSTFLQSNSMIDTVVFNGTYIPEYLLSGVNNVKNIVVGNNVKSIYSGAFQNCTGLTSVTFEENSNLTSIGSYAFSGCTSLTNITIPDGVTSIDRHTFYKCSSLTSISIPSSVTSIGDSAFSGCSSLISINIPDSVTSIGTEAFLECTSLISVSIQGNLTTIAKKTFFRCSLLANINIPNSVTSIGNSAFSDCNSLKSITIPNGVTSIGLSAFSGCSSLTSITIPDSVTSIGYNGFNSCSSLKSIILPKGLTSIERNMFNGCKSLSGIIIPNSVSYIDDWAFLGCTSLTSITIPDSVTFIGQEAFYDCTSLESITIGIGMKNIKQYAFYVCTALTSINFNGTKAQWKDVHKGSSWDSYTGDYVIHCTDGDISK